MKKAGGIDIELIKLNSNPSCEGRGCLCSSRVWHPPPIPLLWPQLCPFQLHSFMFEPLPLLASRITRCQVCRLSPSLWPILRQCQQSRAPHGTCMFHFSKARTTKRAGSQDAMQLSWDTCQCGTIYIPNYIPTSGARFPLPPHPKWHLVVVVFFIIVTLLGVWWYLIVVLCITND